MVEVPNKKELKTLTLSKEHDWRPQTGLDDLGHGHKLNIIAKKKYIYIYPRLLIQ